jgi:hypothetical protein
MQTLLPMNPPHDSSPAQFNEALRGLLSGQAQVANASEQQQQQQQTQQQRQQGLDRPSPGLSLRRCERSRTMQEQGTYQTKGLRLNSL